MSRLGKEAAPQADDSSRFSVSHNAVADSDASKRFVQKHGLPERAAPAAEPAVPAAQEVGPPSPVSSVRHKRC